MQVLLIGCEYSGTTTLADGIQRWSTKIRGKDNGLLHDHWKIPHVSGHRGSDSKDIFTPEEQAQFLALTPKAKEMTQRHSLAYHTQPAALRNPDFLVVGLHIESAIYGPRYFDYYVGDRVSRRWVIDHYEAAIVEFSPDMPLVLVKASAETIRRRMQVNPHFNPVLQESDIESVLDEFETEFERSSIHHKFVIDTSEGSAEETLAKFIEEFEPYLNESDKLSILAHQAKQRGEWI